MKTLCLLWLFRVSFQLQCDKKEITAHVGGQFLLHCKYDSNRFLYSVKYWCRGDTRNTCEILVNSEVKTKPTHRSHIVDMGRRGMLVKFTALRFDDAGVYWVGIDKIYADIMTPINVVITEVPVSKPRLWPLSSLVDRPTCWGQPVTVRCGCTKGTGVRYAWYHQTHYQDVLLHRSSDFNLHCGAEEKHSDYYCIASNDISSEGSDVLSVQVLVPADSSCVYVINMQGQPIYDCADRMSTCTAKTSPTPATSQATMKIHSRNQSLQINQTDQDRYYRAWTRVPFWYTLLRWGSFASLLIFLYMVIKCMKARHKRARRKREICFSRMPHLAQ